MTPTAEPTTSAASATASTTPSPSPGPRTDSYEEADPTISPQALKLYGQDRATTATKTAVAFSERVFYDSDCITKKRGRDADRCARSLGEAMTNAARTEWESDVQNFLADDGNSTQSTQDVQSLTFYSQFPPGPHTDKNGHTFEIAASGPLVVDRRIQSVSTAVDNDGQRLDVEVTASAVIRRTVDGNADRIGIRRNCTYRMASVGDGWKIDGWHGTWRFFKPE